MIVLDISSWIQALAAVAIVVLTGWTLAVLRRYATDTKTIAKVSAAQTENSQMPFLGVVQRTGRTERFGINYWAIQNQGFGPALNVHFSIRTQEAKETYGNISALAPGEEYSLAGDKGSEIGHGTIIRIQYSSLSDVAYMTNAQLKNGQMTIGFQKPPF